MRTQAEIIMDGLDRKQWPASRLAKEIGKTPQFIGNVLRGEKEVTLPDTVYAIADALDLNSDDLFLAIERIPPDVVRMLADNPKVMGRVRAYIKNATIKPAKHAG